MPQKLLHEYFTSFSEAFIISDILITFAFLEAGSLLMKREELRGVMTRSHREASVYYSNLPL